VSLAILNLAELNLHTRPCLWYSLFCAESGVNLPPASQHIADDS